MAKKFSVKSKSSIFKSLGLLALILFTFYFIYNYLATGSFSLKPRASEIVTTDVNSCGSLKIEGDCLKYKNQGCSWVVGPSTTKTENVPQVTTVPVTNYLQVDCTDNDCSSGRHGCSYTTTSKTVNQTQVQAVYECDDGSGVSQSKCIQLGGAWVKTGTRTVTVPVTTTTKSCNGSWENPVTTQQSVTTYTTKVVQVPGVGSCTGTLKPLTVQATPTSPVGGGGGGSSGGGVSRPAQYGGETACRSKYPTTFSYSRDSSPDKNGHLSARSNGKCNVGDVNLGSVYGNNNPGPYLDYSTTCCGDAKILIAKADADCAVASEKVKSVIQAYNNSVSNDVTYDSDGKLPTCKTGFQTVKTCITKAFGISSANYALIFKSAIPLTCKTVVSGKIKTGICCK